MHKGITASPILNKEQGSGEWLMPRQAAWHAGYSLLRGFRGINAAMQVVSTGLVSEIVR